MKDKFEIEIDPDGSKATTIYQDGVEDFAKDLDAEISFSCRASDVEWEEVSPEKKGWVVRSVVNREMALRLSTDVICSSDPSIPLVVFPTRELAIQMEIQFFWNLKQGKASEPR